MSADFVPKRHLITDVTNSVNAVVTTEEDHEYEIGQFVRLHVPSQYSMVLNTVEAIILDVTSDTFTTDVDTTQLFAFSVPSAPPPFTQAHCVPITGNEDNIANFF